MLNIKYLSFFNQKSYLAHVSRVATSYLTTKPVLTSNFDGNLRKSAKTPGPGSTALLAVRLPSTFNVTSGIENLSDTSWVTLPKAV